ncbi:uncharacterized protein LOC124384915 isoform X2 [Silurus meridionalis]|uniref:uncharacterized protein LOC124384915 isoform X2 n=1 Tax=Silurus meridionalis TaxID=175797 RepID=UPI001EEB8B9B|nr:uncharacterized protein LOC124384915 isoform X2 [Silurus meridionalis]
MASVALLFFGLMFSVHTGNSFASLLKLKCESAVGVISQNTNIPCSIDSRYKSVIRTVFIKRIGEKKPCFIYQPHENTITGDPRFKVLGGSSLQLQNTAISDEGAYKYFISTTVGWDTMKFTISVTEEGGSNLYLERKDHKTEISVTWTIIIVVVVIGCLIIILLVVLWFTRKYLHSLRKAKSMELPWNFSKPADVDEKFALNEPVNNPYKKQLMPEENVTESRLIL